MKLVEGRMEESYQISDILAEEGIMRRLEALGMNEGTQLTVMNKKKHGAVVIKLRGTKLALGRQIAQAIEIKEIVKR